MPTPTEWEKSYFSYFENPYGGEKSYFSYFENPYGEFRIEERVCNNHGYRPYRYTTRVQVASSRDISHDRQCPQCKREEEERVVRMIREQLLEMHGPLIKKIKEELRAEIQAEMNKEKQQRFYETGEWGR